MTNVRQIPITIMQMANESKLMALSAVSVKWALTEMVWFAQAGYQRHKSNLRWRRTRRPESKKYCFSETTMQIIRPWDTSQNLSET